MRKKAAAKRNVSKKAVSTKTVAKKKPAASKTIADTKPASKKTVVHDVILVNTRGVRKTVRTGIRPPLARKKHPVKID